MGQGFTFPLFCCNSDIIFFMKLTKSFFILSIFLLCNCVKIVTDTEKTAKNSSASSRINNSQSSSNNVLKELD
jgi:hypothetical protein